MSGSSVTVKVGAKDMMFTGRALTAEEARAAGFVARVVSDLETAKKEIAEAIVKAPPVAHSIIVGDVLYNLRSCLDHLVHQLILALCGVEVEELTGAGS